MIVESDLLDLIDAGSLRDEFTAYNGTLQPAIGFQLMAVDELKMTGRTLVIRSSGGSHFDSNVQKPIVSVYVFGLQNKADAIICKMIAVSINDYFSSLRNSETIFSVIPKTSDPILLFTDLGRPVFELNFELLYNR